MFLTIHEEETVGRMNEKCISHFNLSTNFQDLYNANMYFRLRQENRIFFSPRNSVAIAL